MHIKFDKNLLGAFISIVPIKLLRLDKLLKCLCECLSRLKINIQIISYNHSKFDFLQEN